MNIPGSTIKSKHGKGRIIKMMPKEHPKIEDRYMVKLDNPGLHYQARTVYPPGGPVHYEAGIIFLFENEFEVLKLKQGELF